MKTILLPTDFSIAADNAANYIVNLCKVTGTVQLILYHSYSPVHHNRILLTDLLEPSPFQLAEQKEEASNNLKKLTESLLRMADDSVKITYIADDQDLVSGIKEIVLSEQVDVVAIGISGVGENGKNLVGRNTLRITKECKTSLFIVPPFASFNGIRTSLLACDLSDVEERLPAELLKKFLRQVQSDLLVINVDHRERKGAYSFIREETALHKLLDDIKPEIYYVDNKNKVEGILEFATKYPVDLLIAIYRERGLLEQFFHYSITQKLAVKTNIPLFIIHK